MVGIGSTVFGVTGPGHHTAAAVAGGHGAQMQGLGGGRGAGGGRTTDQTRGWEGATGLFGD